MAWRVSPECPAEDLPDFTPLATLLLNADRSLGKLIQNVNRSDNDETDNYMAGE